MKRFYSRRLSSPALTPAAAPSPMARSLALAFGAFGGLIVAASPVPLRAQTPPVVLPQGAVVVNGAATISQTGHQLTVVNTPGTAINWQTFNIGAGNTAHFQQQSAASSVLNRVVGPDPSQIYGALTSNGRIVLVNPAGIVFGAGAAVDTAGFVASTVNISDADWRAGRLRFAEPGSAGTIQLQGAAGQVPAANIRAQGGDIVLIAPQVDIASGAVARATGGDVLVAAGRGVELTGRGYEGIRLLVQAPGDKATNLGKLEGDAVAIFARNLRNLGTVQATGATVRDGRVMLVAADSAEVGGQIIANRTVNGQNSGGNVTVLGHNLSLQGAQIDASGTHAGGQVNIGGNWQGRGNPLQDAPQALAAVGGAANAQNTQVDAATRINASATQNGNAGQVVVWADGRTDFAGQIQAKGGAQGGNGGQVEVSGKQVLKFADAGRVDTRASNGDWGTLLLDPANFTVASTGGDITGSALGGLIDSNGNLTLTNSGGTVSTGLGDIFINDNVTWTNSTARVTFVADNDIHLNGTLTNAGAVGTSPAVTFVSNNPSGTLYFGSTANAKIDLGANGFATSTMETRTNVGRTAGLVSGFTVFQDKTWLNLGTVQFEGNAQLRLNSFGPPAVDGQFVNNGLVQVSLNPGANALAEGRPSNLAGGTVTNAGQWIQTGNATIHSQFINTSNLTITGGSTLTTNNLAPSNLSGVVTMGSGSLWRAPSFNWNLQPGGGFAGALKLEATSGGIAFVSSTAATINVDSLTLLAQSNNSTLSLGSNLTWRTTPSVAGFAGGDISLIGGLNSGIGFGLLDASGSAGGLTVAGGAGGAVRVETSGGGTINGVAITARGGDGLNGATSNGEGGAGGRISLVAGVNGAMVQSLDVSGGKGGDSSVGAFSGASGGTITVAGSGLMHLDPTSGIGTLLASGGNGGNGLAAGAAGGAGGAGGVIHVGAPTLTVGSGTIISNGGAGGDAFASPTAALNGLGGLAGAIAIDATGASGSLSFAGNVNLSARGLRSGLDNTASGLPAFTQTASVQLSSGTGGIHQTSGAITVPDGSKALLNLSTTGDAVFAGVGNVIGLMGSVGGDLQGDDVIAAMGLSVGGDVTFNTLGNFEVLGSITAGGAMTVNAGSIVVQPFSSVQASSVNLSASGEGVSSFVYVYSPVTSTSGDITIQATGMVRAQTGGSLNSARDVLIGAGPGTWAAAPTVAVALGSGFGAGGGGATQVVAARNVSISTGGGDLVVQAEQAAIPNYSVKLVSAADMTLNLGTGTLSIQGGAAAGSFALVDPTNAGAQLNITAGAINLGGGGAAGAYAGLASAGTINNLSSAPINVTPGVGGAVLVATNFDNLGLTIPAASRANGPIVVNPNTGAVTVGGLPLPGGVFVAGSASGAFAPVVPSTPAPAPTGVATGQVLFTILNTLAANQPNTSGAPSSNRRSPNGIVVTDNSCTPGS